MLLLPCFASKQQWHDFRNAEPSHWPFMPNSQTEGSVLAFCCAHFQLRITGDIAGPSGGQGSSAHPEKPLIKEDNALATLQAAFPKEVKYKTIKGPPSRSAQLYAFCTTSRELTGKFGDSMTSHQESCPVQLCQSCCNNHQGSMQHEQHLQALLLWLPLQHTASMQ